MNDEELQQLLKHWEAPATPRSLEQRVFPRIWLPLWGPLFPVAAGVALVILVVVLIARNSERGENNLSAFQPVTELKPRIVRSAAHETK